MLNPFAKEWTPVSVGGWAPPTSEPAEPRTTSPPIAINTAKCGRGRPADGRGGEAKPAISARNEKQLARAPPAADGADGANDADIVTRDAAPDLMFESVMFDGDGSARNSYASASASASGSEPPSAPNSPMRRSTASHPFAAFSPNGRAPARNSLAGQLAKMAVGAGSIDNSREVLHVHVKAQGEPTSEEMVEEAQHEVRPHWRADFACNNASFSRPCVSTAIECVRHNNNASLPHGCCSANALLQPASALANPMSSLHALY